MPGAHQNLEHAEHATHNAGHGGSNKLFGVTMALIGALIAISAAMVGAERNELTRAMIKQTQAHSDYTSASTKFRLIMIELEKQHARIATARDPQGGWSPVGRFIELSQDYSSERNLSKAWADSYDPLVDAHFDAAERYEHAQLIAEIGIVLASLAVLLAGSVGLISWISWGGAVLLSVLCIIQLGRIGVTTGSVVRVADEHIQHTEETYLELRNAHASAGQDEAAIDRLDPDGKMRAAFKSGKLNHETVKREGDVLPVKAIDRIAH
jgi:hypothetical protein